MRPRLSPGPRLATGPQGDLSWRWVPDTSLPLRPYPPWWAHYLACPVHDLQSGVHGPATLRLSLPSDAPGGRPCCAVSHPRRSQLGALRDPVRYLTDGSLSPDMCTGAAELGDGADAVRAAAARLYPGR